jgi:hypothetical protein
MLESTGTRFMAHKSDIFNALAFAHLPSQGVPQDIFIPLAQD